MEESHETFDWPVVRLYLTSHKADFEEERNLIIANILPLLKSWSAEKKISLQFKEIRWGISSVEDESISVLREIEATYYNGILPVFINITCDSLGILPLWGDAPDSVVKEYQARLGMTDLEMDILYCAQRADNVNCLHIVRDDSFLQAIEGSIQFLPADIVSKQSLQYGLSQIRMLPEERVIKHSYRSVSWSEEKNAFAVVLDQRLCTALKERLKLCITRDKTAEELLAYNVYDQMLSSQKYFVTSRSKDVRGRSDVLKQVEDYIAKGNRDVPLLILGAEGSGKTSALAKCVDVLQSKINSGQLRGAPQPWSLFYHFVGASSKSTSVVVFLKRLLQHLHKLEEMTKFKGIESVSQQTCNMLCSQETKPVIVLMDGVDQLNEDHVTSTIGWLPRKMSSRVRCVLTLATDSAQHKALQDRECKSQEIHLSPIENSSKRTIIQDLYSKCGRRLAECHVRALLANRSSQNPLWLETACERLRHAALSSDDAILDYIHELPNGLLCLMERVLDELNRDVDGKLISATLCMLHVSSAGLLQCELLQLLANDDITPPPPFDEKNEKESSEKEKCEKRATSKSLTQEKWRQIYDKIKQFLCPHASGFDEKIGFYHKILHQAVHNIYFNGSNLNSDCDDSENIYRFWHSKLADFFQNCSSLDRKCEEYLHHLSKMGDDERLCEALCDWQMIDKLFHEEFSAKLLTHWRQAGGIDLMTSRYKLLLTELEYREPKDEAHISSAYERFGRILMQAGKYGEALELAKVALKWEEKELGGRPSRLAELYSLMAEIYDEKMKLNDFVSPSQIPDLRKTISYGRKSIELRDTLPGDHHKLRRGLSLMKLAFSLESWEACGGDSSLSGDQALQEGNRHIDSALAIFEQLNDIGHYAEALMTKGVLAPRGTSQQLKLYDEAMEICSQIYGEYSLLTSRLYINIGIVHEDTKDYVKAFEFFKKWAKASETVYGSDHPKTLRAKGVLKEPRYRLVALRLKEQHELTAAAGDEPPSAEDEGNIAPAVDINSEVEQLLDGRPLPLDDADDMAAAAAALERHEEDDDFDVQPMVAEELQLAINDILRRALGQLDSRAEVLQNLLNNITLTPPHSDAISLDAPGSDRHTDDDASDSENHDNGPEVGHGS